MDISVVHIIEKMVTKLRNTQGDVEAGTVEVEKMKSSLLSVKVYCDLLLDELDENGALYKSKAKQVSTKREQDFMFGDTEKNKVVAYEDEDDANGDSIFDF